MSNRGTRFARSLDPEDARTLMASVREHELPPVLDDLIADYQTFDGARPPFMWKWVHKLAPRNTLPCVDADYTDAVTVDKTITILFVTLLDDVLEKRRDRATFREASKIPFEWRSVDWERDDIDANYVAFAERVWETLLDRIRRGPAYERYEELFGYDVKKAIDAIEYSDLVIRRPEVATMVDMKRYESHNMAMLAYADIDLMHASSEIGRDLSTLREAIWHAQQMARIGNWVSTWERELREGDFSTAVIIYALENGIVDRSELREIERADEETYDRVVERIRDHEVEAVFLRWWDDHYERLSEIDASLSSMDLSTFVDGTEEVLRYHLASTGLK